jgi:hypothetical protein
MFSSIGGTLQEAQAFNFNFNYTSYFIGSYLQRSFGDGTIDRFKVFRNNVSDHNGQIGAGYLFDSSFQ